MKKYLTFLSVFLLVIFLVTGCIGHNSSYNTGSKPNPPINLSATAGNEQVLLIWLPSSTYAAGSSSAGIAIDPSGNVGVA